jgi:hypothetical protein
MFKPTLVRKAVEVPPELTYVEAYKAVADKAATQLGYTPLRSAIPLVELKHEGQAEVAKVFESMGFESLDFDTVRRYQKWYARKHSEEYRHVEWKAESLKDYRDQVPAFALSRALEIKSHLPNAQFSVEYPTYVSVPDPFLRMDYKGSAYYLEAWDEPKFEGRRTA